MKRVLIAGGSGFVGEHLRRLFVSQYCEVYILSTQSQLKSQPHIIFWNPIKKYIELKEATHFDTIINLAGANIGERYWTKNRKKELIDSRIQSTAFLSELIASSKIKVDYFIQTSAIGYYGDRGKEKLTEEATAGRGFLSELCVQWEKVSEFIPIPYSILRFGVVFHPKEGAFSKLVMGLRFRFMILLGRGQQYVSWIEVDDLCRLISFSSEKRLSGVYNAVSPQSIPFFFLLKKYNKKFGGITIPFIVPSFIVRWLLGDFSELFLFSQRVECRKIEKEGFVFHCPDIKSFFQKYKKKF